MPTVNLPNQKSYKGHFPLLTQDVVYLDSAATTQKPNGVIEAMSKFQRTGYGTVHRAIYSLSEESTACYSTVRGEVASFIGATQPEEIIFTRGTTDGLNLLAYTLGEKHLGKGDVILISELEHHSNIIPWQLAAERKGAELKAVKMLPTGEIDQVDMEAILAEGRVKIVSFGHVSNVLGTIHPVKELAALAKAHGAIVVVDGAQAPSHLPIDVVDLGCDFYAFSGHKMYGPTGIGILYGRYALLEELPPYQGGGDMIAEVTLDHSTYQQPPLKFEAGTPPITEVIGLGAAIEFIQSVGVDVIEAHEKGCLEYALGKIKTISDIEVLGEPKARSGIIPFVHKELHPLDVATLLNAEGISIRSGHMCAQPALKQLGYTSICRASIGIYTTFEDIDRLISGLEHLLG